MRIALRIVLAVFFAAAGTLHLRSPAPFLSITPDWVPYAPQVILLTGIFEWVASVALLTRRFRAAAAIGLAAYAVCVYPANVKHAIDGIDVPGLPSSWWYHGPRLALQPVIIWCALFAGGIVDWPFSSTGRHDRGASS